MPVSLLRVCSPLIITNENAHSLTNPSAPSKSLRKRRSRIDPSLNGFVYVPVTLFGEFHIPRWPRYELFEVQDSMWHRVNGVTIKAINWLTWICALQIQRETKALAQD